MGARTEARRQREKVAKRRRGHRRHKEWIMNARDWEDVSRDDRRKWLEEKLLRYHDPQGWLLDGAKGEDAKNIAALVLRMPPHRFARKFAQMLLEDFL
jgi:hypothetical protein